MAKAKKSPEVGTVWADLDGRNPVSRRVIAVTPVEGRRREVISFSIGDNHVYRCTARAWHWWITRHRCSQYCI